LLSTLDRLLRAKRLLEIKIAGQKRLIAVEDAARYRDALGIPLPPGLPKQLLEATSSPMLELIRRYARTHGPFTLQQAAQRFGLAEPQTESVLRSLVLDGRVVEGGFRPGGVHREWCDAEVLRMIRRKSLARLRKEIEPVEQQMLARLETHWQGVLQRRRGLDALLDTIESLQGAPIPASLLESAILPARLAKYAPSDLDTLIAAGEVVWCGLDPLGERDGRIGLYLADKLTSLLPPARARSAATLSPREEAAIAELQRSGALFFAQLHDAVGGGYPGETLDALWNLVWQGVITNDTFHALRAYAAKPTASRSAKRQHNTQSFRSRRTTPPSAQGRWALLPDATVSSTEWSHAIAQQLLTRYGIVSRETVTQENIPGGFSAVYDVLKAMEESGRIRRGYFVAGLGATQFALPSAVDLLRSLRNTQQPERAEILSLAATDPANPYGAVLPWPAVQLEAEADGAVRSLTRSVGAMVILRNGELIGYLRRNNPNILVFLPPDEPERTHTARDLAVFLSGLAQDEMRREGEAGHRGGLLIATINGQATHQHLLSRFLQDAGFQPAPMGFNVRRVLPPVQTASAEVQ
jgi:ATP-dependent Lhr-like helicase